MNSNGSVDDESRNDGEQSDEEEQKVVCLAATLIAILLARHRRRQSEMTIDRSLSEETEDDEKLCRQVRRLASAMENMCCDKTIRYAKELWAQLEPLQGEFTENVLFDVHQYFLENKNRGAAFVLYNHQRKIDCVRSFVNLNGYDSSNPSSSFGSVGGGVGVGGSNGIM